MIDFDVIVVGSGIVGSTAALALAQNTSLQVAIIDSRQISAEWQSAVLDHRVSAISLVSQRIFQHVNVWKDIQAKRTSPYVHMHVWEEASTADITFNASSMNESQLGCIIEDSVMRTCLYDAFSQYSNLHVISPVQLIAMYEKTDSIELKAEDGREYSTRLLIAADGANSWVREQAGIQLKTHDYEHTAIVATVKTALPHQSTAWQRFLKKGPLAFLPLQEPHTSSIVWSTHPLHAKELLAMDQAMFEAALSEAFEYKLGKASLIGERYHFPLQMRHAKNYVKDRIALIGDAAHTLHPLAGQGVNLGLLDAACLVEIIMDALEKKRNFSSFSTLRRYERWRKGDNLLMLSMVEMLKNIFVSDAVFFQKLRQLGLNFTDKNFFLKSFFMKYALGKRTDLPYHLTAYVPQDNKPRDVDRGA